MSYCDKKSNFAPMKILLATILGLLLSVTVSAQTKPLSYIDTRIGTAASSTASAGMFGKGTEEYAHVIPAVLEPNGMTFWTPQTRLTEEKCVCPYYYGDSHIQGFRVSHWISGGCTQDYGSFTICPADRLLITPSSSFSHGDEIATPAYYSAYLKDYGVKAEMTGCSHSAIFRFTYDNPRNQYLYITCNNDEGVGEIEVMTDVVFIRGKNPVHRIYQGWGEPAGQSGWMALQLNNAVDAFGRIDKNTIWLKFKRTNKPVLVKCGTSFTSYENAKSNLAAEIADWDFDAVRKRLEGVWNKHLDKIRVSGMNDKNVLASFYTSLYHASFLPHDISDVSGSYPMFANGGKIMDGTKGKKYYDDYSVWDTYRALHPLLNIISPTTSGQMMQSLVDKYEQGGWMPIFPCWNSYTAAMIGDHCGSLFADAYVKGIRNFDYRKAYEGARKNAFESPATFEEYRNGMGRRALKSYLEHGYVPLSDSVKEAFHTNEQVSRTLEYAYDDYRKLTARSGNYRNVVKPEFINMTSRESWITEGAPCHYMWYAPQDPEGLVRLIGGESKTYDALESMYAAGKYWHGNEPCHQVAYMADYIGKPWLTAQWVRSILEQEYRNEPGGLSGNDDAGQMSAWYIFSSLGFYPVCPGTTEYAIGSPVFPKVEIPLENGKVFTVVARNASKENMFVQSATINGRPLYRPFISHDDILAGATVEFVMGNKPSATWGTETSLQRVYNVMDFGAKGDGVTDDAKAVQAAIDAASMAKGQVLIPAGHTFMVSPIELKSNIDLHLESTARLLANPDEAIYNMSAFGDNIGEGMLWIYANNAENITISGSGVIDGNGIAFMGAELEDSYELKELPVRKYRTVDGRSKTSVFDPRPHLLTMFGCQNIEIKEVTIQNGAYWTVHLVGCLDAYIHDMALLNNLKIRNGDGIDLDHTQNVLIRNCFITSGDDCVCLKNRREYSEGYTNAFPYIAPGGITMRSQKCGNIRVENCHMTSRSCSIKIGSENMDSISNVIFDNCYITASNRGLGIQNRDEGTVTDVVFQNMKVECWLWTDVWWGKAEPIYVTSYPRAVGNHKDAGWRFPKGATEGKCGEVSRIVFRNVDCVSENGCFVGGDVAGKVKDIIFDNVNITFKRYTNFPLGVYDRRPCLGEGFVKGKTHALVIDNAEVRGADAINVTCDDNFPKSNNGDKIYWYSK